MQNSYCDHRNFDGLIQASVFDIFHKFLTFHPSVDLYSAELNALRWYLLGHQEEAPYYIINSVKEIT